MPKVNTKSEKCQRVPVEDAAAEIGCYPQYLRQQMRAKKWDLGQVIYPKGPRGQCTYLVFRAKLDKFLGIERVSDETD